MLQAVASGQVQASGLAVTPKEDASPRRLSFASGSTMPRLQSTLPAGSTGDAAIFTNDVKVAHIIRKVLLRQIAILNYVNPF